MVDENGGSNVGNPESMEVDYVDLVRRCSKSDRAAQEELYSIFAPKMNGVVLRYAANREDAEKILQDSFVDFFRYLGEKKRNESPEGIIKEIVHKKILLRYKESVKMQFQEVFYPYKNEEKDMRIQEMSPKDLLPFWQSLPDVTRIIYTLSLDGCTNKDIAEQFDTTVFAVENYIAQAKDELSKKITGTWIY